MSLKLTTAAFQPGGPIPKKYTCDGSDISPAFDWDNAPSGTQGFALIGEDPDAPSGTFTHWVLYGIASTLRALPEGVPGKEVVANVGQQGRNDFRKIGYGGPCPPPGKPHRYFFKLLALNTDLKLKPGLSKRELERAVSDHILAEAQVMGTYGR